MNSLALRKRSDSSVALDHLFVAMPLERVKRAENSLTERDMEALARVNLQAVQSIVVCLCVNGPQERWLFTCNPRHLSAPDRALASIGSRILFYLGEQFVVLPLEPLVVACAAAKAEDKLKGADGCNTNTNRGIQTPASREELGYSAGAEKDDKEVEPAVPPLQRKPTRGVIKRVSQCVEADVVDFSSHVFRLVHVVLLFHFPGVGPGLTLGVGWRGPGPASGFGLPIVVGWRTPEPWMTGCRTPEALVSVFRTLCVVVKIFVLSFTIVSLWLLHLGMAGVWSRSNAATHRTIEIQTFCTLEVKHTKYSINTFGGDQVLEALG